MSYAEVVRVAEIRTALTLLADAVTLSMSPVAGKWERDILKRRLDEALLVMERTKPGQAVAP